MGLLDTIRSILGLGGDRSDRGEQVERRTTDVRVERDPDESTGIDTTSEVAVKGTDGSPEHEGPDGPGGPDEAATAGTDATDSTDSLAGEPPEPEPEPETTAEPTDVTDHAGTEKEAAEAAGATHEKPPTAVEPDETTPGEADEADVTEGEPAKEASAGGVDATGGGVGDEPVRSISGIGQAYGKRLSDAGIETVADLADADSAELADASGISEKRITDWQEAADDRLG